MREANNGIYLFIGGTHDGENITVENGRREWAVPIIKFNPPDYQTGKDMDSFGWNTVYSETYYKVVLGANESHDVCVFVHESIMYDEPHRPARDYKWQIMCRLINHYRVIK
jgi:hypothetical protein